VISEKAISEIQLKDQASSGGEGFNDKLHVATSHDLSFSK